MVKILLTREYFMEVSGSNNVSRRNSFDDISGFVNIEISKPDIFKKILEKTMGIFASLSDVKPGEKVYYDPDEGKFFASGSGLREYSVIRLANAFLSDSIFQRLTTSASRMYAGHSIDTTIDALHLVDNELKSALVGVNSIIDLSKGEEDDPTEWINLAKQLLAKLELFDTVLPTAKVGMEHLKETYKDREDSLKLNPEIEKIEANSDAVVIEAKAQLQNRIAELEKKLKEHEQIQELNSGEPEILEIAELPELIEITQEKELEFEEPEIQEEIYVTPAKADEIVGEQNAIILSPDEELAMYQANKLLDHFPTLSEKANELNDLKDVAKIASNRINLQKRFRQYRSRIVYLSEFADKVIKAGGNIVKIDDKIADLRKNIQRIETSLEAKSNDIVLKAELELNQQKLERLVIYKEASSFARERTERAKLDESKAFLKRMDHQLNYLFPRRR